MLFYTGYTILQVNALTILKSGNSETEERATAHLKKK
jgi:hypothetical protein